MHGANVKLSTAEWQLVTDRQVILTKNEIIKKVYTLFGILGNNFQEIIQQKKALLPAEAVNISPKISKGENYLGLPWVVLDYPRFYTRQHVLAIRCFFWWGNFFSITLHLGGSFLAVNSEKLANWVQANYNNGWYVNAGADAWQHHFEADNYVPLENEPSKTTVWLPGAGTGFIKLAKKLPLQQWDGAFAFFTQEFKEIITLLAN